MFKKCTKCGRVKLITEFRKKSSRKDGVDSWCKKCSLESVMAYQAAHPEKKRERDHKYREAHPDKVRGYFDKWEVLNPDKVKESQKKYREAHPEKALERKRKWYAANKEQANEHYRARYAENPEYFRAINKNRRANRIGSPGSITAAEWQQLKEFYNYTCLCCGRREPEIELTHDHVKPLAMQGENTIGNSQTLCRSCNSRKGKKHIDYRNGRIMQ